MKNLLRNILDAPAATAASALVSGLAVVIATDMAMPKWVLLSAAILSAVLSAFSGPNKP